MKSNAATAEQYLASLPEDRREAVSNVRGFLLDTLRRSFGAEFQECMQYGVIAYCVPHSVWPHGHHTNPTLPLMYMGLSSQKNDMVVYMLFLLHNQPEREWFDQAWKATGRKNYLEVTGAGCCLRFRKLEELALDVVGEAIRRMPAKKYLEDHTAMLARLGKGPDGKPLKKSGRTAEVPETARAQERTTAKATSAPPKKRAAGKNTATKKTPPKTIQSPPQTPRKSRPKPKTTPRASS